MPQGSRTRGETRAAAASAEQPPSKRIKRVHSVATPIANTPPPSPPPEGSEHEDINDEIVTGVLRILRRSDNRPHTVKELAVLLSPSTVLVENSANPHAIISSRLNAYLKRDATESSPCLLVKKLITSHPRRIYFYLSDCPAQPIPEQESVNLPKRSIVSPVSDDEEMRRRVQLSPSPEVDLSSPEFDDDISGPPSPNDSLSGLLSRDRTMSPSAQKHALSSPTLEGDEQEFTQSAIQLKQRSVSREVEEHRRQKRARELAEKDEKHEEGKESEDAAALLGFNESPVESSSQHSLSTNPLVRQSDAQDKFAQIKKEATAEDTSLPPCAPVNTEQLVAPTETAKVDWEHSDNSFRSWGADVQSPENVDLDELDDLLGAEFA